MKEDKILEIAELSKSYDGKVMALSDCSFSLTKGKICAVFGESGSGKSTLLRLIAGLERPNCGTITIDGNIVTDDAKIVVPQRRNVGFVFQDYALFPHKTVEENIGFGVQENKREVVNRLLKLVKMEGYNDSFPSQLSGGQEQRVALARTLAIEPKLLLLDEPFSNLDASLKSGLRRQIQSITKELGTSMIFITHDIYDAIDIADEIIFLHDGNMLQHSSIQDLLNSNSNEVINKTMTDLKSNAQHILDLFT